VGADGTFAAAARKPHPLGCHNPRVPDRQAMKVILFVLRTGCQWNALNAAGLCSSSSAHRHFMERTEAGVFHAFRQEGLLAYDGLKGGGLVAAVARWGDDQSLASGGGEKSAASPSIAASKASSAAY
jgi:hypothetical protein